MKTNVEIPSERMHFFEKQPYMLQQYQKGTKTVGIQKNPYGTETQYKKRTTTLEHNNTHEWLFLSLFFQKKFSLILLVIK